MWQDFTAWIQSPGGARVLQSAIIPVLAVVVAAIVATLIARSAVKASIRRSERAEAASAVGALVAAARVPAGDAHGARLRDEADVRTRLLPLSGAALAADWAAAQIDALHARTPGAPASADVDGLRDRLVEWVGKPARAKRVFSTSAPAAPAREQTAAPQAAAEPSPAIAEPVQQEPAPAERFARPEPGPRRTPAPAEPPAVAIEAEPEEAPLPAAVAPSGDAVPAWQRTRAVERLQQERSRARTPEPQAAEEDERAPVSAAPPQPTHAHRAAVAPASDADEAVRLEAHQQARHARPGDEAPAAAGAAPAATPAPAWLDNYDDEAQVTQNLDLKTPPPVAASAIRDRGAPGEDLVPRS